MTVKNKPLLFIAGKKQIAFKMRYFYESTELFNY